MPEMVTFVAWHCLPRDDESLHGSDTAESRVQKHRFLYIAARERYLTMVCLKLTGNCFISCILTSVPGVLGSLCWVCACLGLFLVLVCFMQLVTMTHTGLSARGDVPGQQDRQTHRWLCWHPSLCCLHDNNTPVALRRIPLL